MKTSSAVRAVIKMRQPVDLSLMRSADFHARKRRSINSEAVMSVPFQRPKAM